MIADGPEYAAYFRAVEAERPQHLVLFSIRHPWRDKAVDPADDAALRAREEELRGGGVFLEFSWAFVLRPADGGTTRLLTRMRGNISPPALRGLADIAGGLADVYESMGLLHGIKRRAEQARGEPRP